MTYREAVVKICEDIGMGTEEVAVVMATAPPDIAEILDEEIQKGTEHGFIVLSTAFIYAEAMKRHGQGIRNN